VAAAWAGWTIEALNQSSRQKGRSTLWPSLKPVSATNVMSLTGGTIRGRAPKKWRHARRHFFQAKFPLFQQALTMTCL
jgi:hypothetical protein